MAELDAPIRDSNSMLTSLIAITVKSSSDRKDIIIEDTKTVLQLKNLVAKELNVSKDQLYLIYRSSTLKDSDTLQQSAVVDGSIVRVIVRALEVSDGGLIPNTQATKYDVKDSPFGLGAVGGLSGLADMGFGSASFADLQQKMQQQMLSNPELMKSLINSPITQEIMSQPGLLKQAIVSNPFMADILQKYPEISEVLENPGVMKQMMSLSQQPALLRELIDPKFTESMGLTSCAEKSANGQPETMSSSDEDKPTSSETDNGFLDIGTESLLKQMIANPKMMADIYQAPYVQAAINFVANNDNCLSRMMNQIPGVKDKEDIQKQLHQSMPYFAQQLVNPEVQGLVCNPRALQAILDIQEGMKELHSEVPGFFGVQPCNPGIMHQVLSSVTSQECGQSDESKYALQLHQLHIMGFTEREENFKILSQSGGDINSVIIHHLQRQHQQEYNEAASHMQFDEQTHVQQEFDEQTHVQQEFDEQNHEAISSQMLLGHVEDQQHLLANGQQQSEDIDGHLLMQKETGIDGESSFNHSEVDMQMQ